MEPSGIVERGALVVVEAELGVLVAGQKQAQGDAQPHLAPGSAGAVQLLPVAARVRAADKLSVQAWGEALRQPDG